MSRYEEIGLFEEENSWKAWFWDEPVSSVRGATKSDALHALAEEVREE